MLTACEPEKDPIQSISQEEDNRKLEDLEAKFRLRYLFTVIIHLDNTHVLNTVHNEFIHKNNVYATKQYKNKWRTY